VKLHTGKPESPPMEQRDSLEKEGGENDAC
jgi:hypothetical protein